MATLRHRRSVRRGAGTLSANAGARRGPGVSPPRASVDAMDFRDRPSGALRLDAGSAPWRRCPRTPPASWWAHRAAARPPRWSRARSARRRRHGPDAVVVLTPSRRLRRPCATAWRSQSSRATAGPLAHRWRPSRTSSCVRARSRQGGAAAAADQRRRGPPDPGPARRRCRRRGSRPSSVAGVARRADPLHEGLPHRGARLPGGVHDAGHRAEPAARAGVSEAAAGVAQHGVVLRESCRCAPTCGRLPDAADWSAKRSGVRATAAPGAQARRRGHPRRRRAGAARSAGWELLEACAAGHRRPRVQRPRRRLQRVPRGDAGELRPAGSRPRGREGARRGAPRHGVAARAVRRITQRIGAAGVVAHRAAAAGEEVRRTSSVPGDQLRSAAEEFDVIARLLRERHVHDGVPLVLLRCHRARHTPGGQRSRRSSPRSEVPTQRPAGRGRPLGARCAGAGPAAASSSWPRRRGSGRSRM